MITETEFNILLFTHIGFATLGFLIARFIYRFEEVVKGGKLKDE